MKRSVLTFLVFATLCVAFAAQAANRYALTGVPVLSPAEVRGWNFLHYRLNDGEGVIHYLANPGRSSLNSVVESQGQAMEYLALIGDADLFAWYAAATEKYFWNEEGYFSWELFVKTRRGEKVTALIDDIRIFKAYEIAHTKKLGDYSERLKELAEEIFRIEVDAEGHAVSYYSAESGHRDSGVNLYYLDVETFDKLARYDPRWREPAETARRILREMPQNEHGFYPVRFEMARNDYEYAEEETFNMVENLYTAIFARAAGRDVKPFVDFLKREAAAGALYNRYDPDGTPVDENESTAVYALAARFMHALDERTAARTFFAKMIATQVGVGRAFMGGFSMDADETVYAFDQLEALLTLREFSIP